MDGAVPKPLCWMKDFTVSTNQLKAAARKSPRAHVDQQSKINPNGSQLLASIEKSLVVTKTSKIPPSYYGGFIGEVMNDSVSYKRFPRKLKQEKRNGNKHPSPLFGDQRIQLWRNPGQHERGHDSTSRSKVRYNIPPIPNLPEQNIQASQQHRVSESAESVKLPPIPSCHTVLDILSRQVLVSQQSRKASEVKTAPLKGLTTSRNFVKSEVRQAMPHIHGHGQNMKTNEVMSSNLQVTPSNGTALSYSKAMSTIKTEQHGCNVKTRNASYKLYVPYRHSHCSSSVSPERDVARKMEDSTEGQMTSSVGLTPLLDELNNKSASTVSNDQHRRHQIKRTISILQSGDNVENDYLVRYDVDDKMKSLIHKLRGGGVVNSLDNLTDEIRDEYEDFLTELDQITYYRLRQGESILAGGYSPNTMVLINSDIPKADLLCSACKPNALSIVYDSVIETYQTLVEKIKARLDGNMKGAKMKYLAIVSKGGPGYMYLLKKNPITPPKLLKDKELLRFWKDLGSCMSKISKEPSVIHMMESNVAGNKQGEMLLQDLEAAMFAHKVKIECPLEISVKGQNMIKTYFNPKKFKEWKQNRYKDSI